MIVRVNDPALRGELLRYLRSAACIVAPVGMSDLDVVVRGAPTEEQARREVSVYLKAWELTTPGASAEIVG